MADVLARRAWLEAAAGARINEIECSILVQSVAVSDSPTAAIAAACARTGLPEHVIEETPFLLLGSVGQIIDKLHRLRDQLGINHIVVRDAIQFAPVVAALSRD